VTGRLPHCKYVPLIPRGSVFKSLEEETEGNPTDIGFTWKMIIKMEVVE